jgi:hypothetical protein
VASNAWRAVLCADDIDGHHCALHPPTDAGKSLPRNEFHSFVIPFVLFATWRALDGALKGNFKQHQRWVMGLFFGALVINGLNNVFFLPGITHDVFFGR